jgi:hypothetical protein
MEDSKTLFCSSKFPWAQKGISSKFIDHFGMYPLKGSPALLWVVCFPHILATVQHSSVMVTVNQF